MSRRRTGAIAAALIVTLLGATPAHAQLSPNCIRNEKKDYCSISHGHYRREKSEERFDETIVFADHSVYEVSRLQATCKSAETHVVSCDATISKRWENSTSAKYTGTYYEGGYKHEYIGDNIHITYFYLD